MTDNAQRIYVRSLVFTREDEERYHYVDTEVDGLTSSDEDVEFDAVGSRGREQQQQAGTQKAASQLRQYVRDSMLRDSLEDDVGDSTASAPNKSGIVVADPSRYEDLTMGARGRRSVQHLASGNGRPDVVPKRTDAEPRHYYLHDDAEEYEEAQLERQHQRREARRAHVPHLELCNSDDEPSDGGIALDLELNDGRVPHAGDSKKKVNRRRVNFGALPRNSNSSEGDHLLDSLEVAENCLDNDGDNDKDDYEEDSYANDRAYGENQPYDQNNSANSYLSIHRNAQTGQRGQRSDENNQAHASTQSSSASRQQLSSHVPPPFSHAQVRRYHSETQSQGQSYQVSSTFKGSSDDSSVATDFVEANRHNLNRKQQRSYGQIHSRKKGKENTVDFERSPQHRPSDSASSAGRQGDAADAVSEQNPVAASGTSDESHIPSAEQLWQSRSQSLAARKESAETQLTGKNRRAKPGLSQNRVARDARTRPVVPPRSTSASYQHRSNVQQQVSTGSFTVPENSPPQKVSVDINLNIVSPRRLLNQPSTSLPVQYTSSPADQVHQYSSLTQAYSNAAAGHYQYPVASQPTTQPFAALPQATADSAVQYTSGIASSRSYAALPHSHSAPHSVSSAYQHSILPYSVDGQGQIIPNQAVQQHLPIRYNYSYPQPLAVDVGNAPQHAVHPYQMQVCSVRFLLPYWRV